MLIKSYDIDKNFSKNDCYKYITKFFVDNKITTDQYYEAILHREKQASFFIGNFVAIPHGSIECKDSIIGDGIVIFRFKNGIEWDNKKVYYVIGIAAKGNKQVDILQNIAISFSSEEAVIDSLMIPNKSLIEKLEWK